MSKDSEAIVIPVSVAGYPDHERLVTGPKARKCIHGKPLYPGLPTDKVKPSEVCAACGFEVPIFRTRMRGEL